MNDQKPLQNIASALPLGGQYDGHVSRGGEMCIAQFTAAAVCLAYGLTDCDIFDKHTRHREATLARQLTMYLLHTTLGYNKSRIGRIFARDPSTVSYACIQIEDLREPGPFEQRVCALEAIVKLAAEDFANQGSV